MATAGDAGFLAYSALQNLDIATLNRHCKVDGIPITYPQHAKVKLLFMSQATQQAKMIQMCKTMNISTDGCTTAGSEKEGMSPKWSPHIDTLNKEQLEDYVTLTPDVLAKLKNWSKSIKEVPDVNDFSIKMYLANANVISEEMFRTYKLSKPYEMRKHVHSMFYNKLPDHPSFVALQAQSNSEQSASADENTEVLFVILDSQSGEPVGGYCTCAIGRSQACVHMGAALFSFAGFIASGTPELPSDPAFSEVSGTGTGTDGENHFALR